MRRCLAALVVLTALVACRNDKPKENETSQGAAYTAIVTWFADRFSNDPDPLVVFVEPLSDGGPINLDDQATVVERTAGVASAQFIDSRDEVFVKTEEGQPAIRDDGVLLAIGPAIRDGLWAEVVCDEMAPDGTVAAERVFRVRERSDGTFDVRLEPD
jgi:hypothetical protein